MGQKGPFIFPLFPRMGQKAHSWPRKVTRPRVTFLGHEVGSGTLSPIQSKVEAIQRIPPPSTKKQLRGFLGVVGFYRSFIPRFSHISASLTDLIKGSHTKVQLNETQLASFEKLKASLASVTD